jgi:hypothetical protein
MDCGVGHGSAPADDTEPVELRAKRPHLKPLGTLASVQNTTGQRKDSWEQELSSQREKAQAFANHLPQLHDWRQLAKPRRR